MTTNQTYLKKRFSLLQAENNVEKEKMLVTSIFSFSLNVFIRQEFADDNFKFNKNDKVLKTGKKYCGKRRKCSLTAISPFPTVFSKDLYCKHVKTRTYLVKQALKYDSNYFSKEAVPFKYLCFQKIL